MGVDLAPIRPIPRTITFQSDITSDKCRATIRQHLKTWKADTVLHDGAPNVGTAWVQDAFSQAELVLQAMKLATEFLVEGGTFVTKVFRSKDYNALLWVFNQLFNKVESTKPPSSRNVSAEIFVVCRGFKAPKRIDPKFLDSRCVFAELSDPTPNNEAKVFNPEKKKRKRDGYEEGDYTQFKEVPASEFVQTTDPIAMLGSLSRLSFEKQKNGDIALAALEKLPETTTEIRQCCNDLRVLGRKEFRMLLRWRLKARETFGFTMKKKPSDDHAGEEVAKVESMDEELRIETELQRLRENETSQKKRDRRRENERKQREIIRMQMHMMPPTEIGLEQAGPNGEDSMFALDTVQRAGAIEKISKGGLSLHAQPSSHDEDNQDTIEAETDSEEDRLDREMDTLYDRYQERKAMSDAKYRAKKARKVHADGDWEGLSDKDQNDCNDIENDEDTERSSNDDNDNDNDGSGGGDDADEKLRPRSQIQSSVRSPTDQGSLTKRASLFFNQDIFKDIGVSEADGSDDSAIDMDADNLDKAKDFRAANKSSVIKDHTKGTTEVMLVPVKGTTLCDTRSTKSTYADANDPSLEDRTEEFDLESDTGFEVVKEASGPEWERQPVPRTDGHLGEQHFRKILLC